MLRKALSAVISVVLNIGVANAAEVVRAVGTSQYNFVIPTGTCLMEDNNARDKLFINTVETLLNGAANKLIVLSVECARQRTWRNNVPGNILDYFMYYIPNNLVDRVFDGDTTKLRKDLCLDMRKQGDATLSGVKRIVADAAKELNANIAVTSTKYIGVVDEDEHGCYAALLIGVKGTDGKIILMSSLVTSTVVRGKPLFSALYHRYQGAQTTERSLQEAKLTAAAFDTRNP